MAVITRDEVREILEEIIKDQSQINTTDMGVKKYEMPSGTKVAFEFDENGVGNITVEAMDRLMDMIGAKEIVDDSNT